MRARRVEVEEGVAVAQVEVGRPARVEHALAQQVADLQRAQDVHVAVGGVRDAGPRDGEDGDEGECSRGDQPGINAA